MKHMPGQTKKLNKAADSSALRELRKRLRREREAMKLDGVDPLRLAMSVSAESWSISTDGKNSAWFPGRLKQARYLAELAGESPEAKTFVDS